MTSLMCDLILSSYLKEIIYLTFVRVLTACKTVWPFVINAHNRLWSVNVIRLFMLNMIISVLFQEHLLKHLYLYLRAEFSFCHCRKLHLSKIWCGTSVICCFHSTFPASRLFYFSVFEYYLVFFSCLFKQIKYHSYQSVVTRVHF